MMPSRFSLSLRMDEANKNDFEKCDESSSSSEKEENDEEQEEEEERSNENDKVS